MALTLHQPENSFVGFPRQDGPIEVVCGQSFATCLPITFGDDYAFQLFVIGQVAEELRDNYSIRLVSQDETIESEDIPIDWFYDADQDVTWLNVTVDIDIDPFIDVECMNFKIFLTVVAYQYFSIIESWGNPMTASLTIDGVLTPFFSGTAASLIDFIAEIQDYLDSQGYDAEAVLTTATGMQITSNDGHTYGLLQITDAEPHSYGPSTVETDSVEGISTCLMYVESTCFTRVVAYRGNENIFGFNYALDPTFYNSVRLPVWIEKPQPIIEENYFLLSDGTKKVLSARYEKEYDGHTEYFDEAMHFKFLAALKHDAFLLDGDEYSAEGKYDIGWISLPGSPILNAPATFKVRPTPFYQSNSNCVTV